jgi:transcriptional antiterminator Rof (Rho-off)
MWKDNMKLSVRKIVCEDGKWLELAQDCDWWQALLLVLRKGIFFFGQLMSLRTRFV